MRTWRVLFRTRAQRTAPAAMALLTIRPGLRAAAIRHQRAASMVVCIWLLWQYEKFFPPSENLTLFFYFGGS
jgi:hypothetical protein